MIRISMVGVVLMTLAGCESNEAREARFQVAKRDCAKLGAAAVLNPTSGPFTSASADAAFKITKACLEKQGFKVD